MPLSLRARVFYFLVRATFKNQKATLAQRRIRDAQNARWMNRPPTGVDVERFDLNGLPAAWIRPSRTSTGRVILYLHGGGYVLGSIENYQMLCGQMAEILNLPLLIPEYRLAPEHPFPAALEDAQMAYRWLLQQGWRAEDILLAGDSAGGGLSLATTLALREAGAPLPGAVVCLSPWADLSLSEPSHQTNAQAEAILTGEDLHEWASFYAGTASLANPLVSPVYADYHGFPRLLIQVGSREVLLDDARRVAEKARAARVTVKLSVWEGMWHVWHIFGGLVPESRAAMQEIGEFIAQS
jgi:acetyl esterase/lipase